MKANSQSGFTLIEVMIAVAIFAVIGAIVFPALIQFIDIRDRVITKHEQLEDLQKTFLFMGKDLRFASNRLGKDEFGELGDATMIVGDDSLMDLTAMYPDLNLGGLNVPRRVRWVLEDNVLMRIQSPVMDPDADTRVLKQKLLENVDRVQIELSVVEDGRNNTSKRWDEETKLPDMVSVVIRMENKVEYTRLFTMLGGDKLEAIAAASNTSLEGGAGGGINGDGDGDADGVESLQGGSPDGDSSSEDSSSGDNSSSDGRGGFTDDGAPVDPINRPAG